MKVEIHVTIQVNGEALSPEAVASVAEELRAQDRSFSGLDDGTQQHRAEEALIERTLVRQEAQARGPEIRKVDIKRELKRAIANTGGPEAFQKHLKQAGATVEEVEADIELRMKIDGLLDGVCKSLEKPGDDACRLFYDEHPEWFTSEEHVRAAHLVRHCAGNALEEHAAHAELTLVRAEIAQGKPFESFTHQCSDCPDNGGDLGYFSRGMMVPEFEEVVFNMQPGEVSDVFKTPFGLHIVKLLDRVPARPRPFDDVKEEVRRLLYEEAENACIDAFTAELKRNATIVREA